MSNRRNVLRAFTSILLGAMIMAGAVSVTKSKARTSEDKFPPTMPLAASNMIITTTESIDGYRIKEYRGIIRGVTVRQPTMGQSFKADLKSVVGGKMSPFTSMCETARQQSMEVLVQRAQTVGANALVGVRYDSSAFGDSDDMGTEVVCYGTAVIIEPSAAPKSASVF